MEKQNANADLPPNYINLGYDADPVAGPSAPRIHEDGSSTKGYSGKILQQSTPPPKYDENTIRYDDADPVAGPSAPRINEDGSSTEDYSEKIIEQPTPPPKYDENPISFGPVPTAPAIDPRILQYNPPSLVFEEIYDACSKYVKSHCCYSSRFINRMKLTDIINGGAFYYSLESYGEKRETAYHYTPYRGGPIDGPQNGRAPNPWDMHVPLMTAFKDMKTQRTIPHTDSVETCSKCSGSGKVTCSSCWGSGRTSCWSCSGSGRDSNGDNCTSCYGSGRRTCSSCGGCGRQTCSKCDGYGKIKSYKILYVTWTNHLTEFVSNVQRLPAKKLKKVTGDTLFSEVKDHLTPIDNAPDDSVNAASVRLLEAHRNSFRSEIIRKQRQVLRAYPFTVAKYKYKEDEGEFYIYGKDKDVYFEDYPTSCCCCICC